MKSLGLACLTTLLLAANPAAASDADDEAPASPTALAQLDGFALGLARAERFSGVLLVAKDGEVRLERAYGKRDAATDHKNSLDSTGSQSRPLPTHRGRRSELPSTARGSVIQRSRRATPPGRGFH